MSKTNTIYSADTIFHYTNTIHKLIEILKYGFVPYYCLEDYQFLNKKLPKIALPMVSFCDVPLSHAYTPMSKYGFYAIGMKKDWAIRNRISPLLYSIDKSPITKSFVAIYKTGKNSLTDKTSEFKHHQSRLRYFISFMKPYQGTLVRGKKLHSNYRFYDEREWRFVPDNSSNRYRLFTEDQYKKERAKISDKKIKFPVNLMFIPDDVKFIIVKKDSQLLDMINRINRIKSATYTSDQLKVLSTRLISSEHLLEDF
jgi:hypothetical protein